MRHKLLIITTLMSIFTAVNGFAYDGTGMWNYYEHSPHTTCPGFNYIPENGEVGILQTDSTFFIVGDDYSTDGTVDGNTYTYSDTYCYEDETEKVIENNSITLTSATTGTGTVSWDFYVSGNKICEGGHSFNVSKQPQAEPVYDASGKWNFTQSGFSNTCDSATTPRSSGYFVVTQTGNRITAVDDLGKQYTGYVNGAEYAVVRTYLEFGGRTSEWHTVTLSSETEGSGQSHFVWDDNCDECWGNWNILLTKDVYTITASATAGGTISPSGTVTLDSGASQLFQINADSGYVISDVLVDNSSIGAVPSHTFTNVTADHTIHSIFQLDAGACESLIKQDFEEGQVPPSGWQLLTTNQNYTWQIQSDFPHAGSYAAEVLYDETAVNPQDEILLSGQLFIKEAILHFWSQGSIYWCRDTFDNCDLEIWIVVGNWDAGTDDDILVGKSDDDWGDNFEWADSSFNLTPMLPNEPIRIGFRYKGTDGAQIVIDDVQICSDNPVSPSLPFLFLLLE